MHYPGSLVRNDFFLIAKYTSSTCIAIYKCPGVQVFIVLPCYGRDGDSYIARTEKPKKPKKGEGNIAQVDKKKIRWFRRQRKASNKRSTRDFISGWWLFGLLPTSILEDIGDSLPRASDRYTYTVSVPNMYHSLGRQGGRRTKRRSLA